MSMTRRGFFSRPIISSMEWAPMTLVPLASLLRKSSTFETVRLKAATVNPWSFMFKIRFWPITASPMTAISALGSMLRIVTEVMNDTRIPAMRQRFLGDGAGARAPRSRGMGDPRPERSASAAQLQARIGFEHGFQARPAHGVHLAEGVQIDRDHLRSE